MSSDQRNQPGMLPSHEIAPRKNLAPLADLFVASWQATMPTIDFAARRDWFCAYVQEIEQRGGFTLCAFDVQGAQQGALLGFILLDVSRAVLEQIVISPSLFGSGLGALLLDEAKQRCPNGLSLDVNMGNPRALRFYEKHGFVRLYAGVNPLSGLPIWHMRWPGT